MLLKRISMVGFDDSSAATWMRSLHGAALLEGGSLLGVALPDITAGNRCFRGDELGVDLDS